MTEFSKKLSQVVPVHSMKAYSGIRGIAPLSPLLGTRCSKWSTSRSGCFTRGTKPRCLLYKRLGAHQSRRFWRRKNFLPSPGFEPRTSQPVPSRAYVMTVTVNEVRWHAIYKGTLHSNCNLKMSVAQLEHCAAPASSHTFSWCPTWNHLEHTPISASRSWRTDNALLQRHLIYQQHAVMQLADFAHVGSHSQQYCCLNKIIHCSPQTDGILSKCCCVPHCNVETVPVLPSIIVGVYAPPCGSCHQGLYEYNWDVMTRMCPEKVCVTVL
jgi:hypothetical protein